MKGSISQVCSKFKLCDVFSRFKRYRHTQILSKESNIWQKLFLFRKVYLGKYYKHYYSQFGEDVVLNDWIAKTKKSGFYVDVGCYHPRKFSNTYFLYKRGWRGINIDLDALKVRAFDLLRPKDINIVAAVSDKEQTVKIYNDRLYSLVTTIDESAGKELQINSNNIGSSTEILSTTLDKVIEKTSYANSAIDLLSIDAEGHDFNVLKSISLERYQPKVIVIESHFRDFEKILRSDIYLYLINKGYKFVNWVGFSLFFVLPNCDVLKPEFNRSLLAD